MSGKFFSAWYQASRAPFFVATLIPLGLGGAVASVQGHWNPGIWMIVLAASFLVHFATNLANDYYDHISGVDSDDSLGGSRVIQEGMISADTVRRVMTIFYLISLGLGIWVTWLSGTWWLILLMIFSFVSSFYYTAPPFRYGYRGLGELFVGMNMGPAMVVGSAAALTGQFVPRALWLSVPIGLSVALILYYQSLSDIEVDEETGKKTLAVRLGRSNSLWGFRLIAIASELSILCLVLTGMVHPVALTALLLLFVAKKVDNRISCSNDWTLLHDHGGPVRQFYLAQGVILILCVLYFR
jgi:1,4-dihydroxy-2-naphthoate polyprenyltransferase